MKEREMLRPMVLVSALVPALLTLTLVPQFAYATVTVTAEVKPEVASIGDRIRYIITIRGDEGEEIDPVVRLLRPEPFEVVDVEVSKEVSPSGSAIGIIVFTLVPFETGRLELPQYIYEWTDAAGNIKSAATGDLFVEINSVLKEGGGEPDRDVILGEAEPEHDWKEYIVPALIIIAVIALVLYLVRRWRKKRDEEAARKIILTPYELAINELEGIERDDLYSAGRVKEYFSSISDAVRRYIEGEFGTNAMELTTYELSRGFPPPISDFSESVVRLLELCDSVKFAKAVPERSEADEALEGAFRFIRSVGARFSLSAGTESGTGGGAGIAGTATGAVQSGNVFSG